MLNLMFPESFTEEYEEWETLKEEIAKEEEE